MFGNRRLLLFRYNPITAVPLPALMVTVAIGVVSGVYIFDAPVREASAFVLSQQKEFQNKLADDKKKVALNAGQYQGVRETGENSKEPRTKHP